MTGNTFSKCYILLAFEPKKQNFGKVKKNTNASYSLSLGRKSKSALTAKCVVLPLGSYGRKTWCVNPCKRICKLCPVHRILCLGYVSARVYTGILSCNLELFVFWHSLFLYAFMYVISISNLACWTFIYPICGNWEWWNGCMNLNLF